MPLDLDRDQVSPLNTKSFNSVNRVHYVSIAWKLSELSLLNSNCAFCNA